MKDYLNEGDLEKLFCPSCSKTADNCGYYLGEGYCPRFKQTQSDFNAVKMLSKNQLELAAQIHKGT